MWKPGSKRPQDAPDSKSTNPPPPPQQKQQKKQQQKRRQEDEAPAVSSDGLPARGDKKAPATFKLSQKTLAMKFMQRKKRTEAERQAAVKEQHKQDTWVETPEQDAPADADDSRLVCVADVPDPSLPLLFGRRSFGGFNKGVEDEFKEASRALRFAASEDKELRDEVSAEEMTERMQKYTGLRGNSSRSSGGGRGGGRGNGKSRPGGYNKRANGAKRQRK